MKRLIINCCLFCVIPVLFASTAVGEEISIYLSDINMTISFPEDSIICTRNMSDDDPILKEIGITPEEVRIVLIAHDRDAEVYNIQWHNCIYVKGRKSEEYSFSALPDAFFEEAPKQIKRAIGRTESIKAGCAGD